MKLWQKTIRFASLSLLFCFALMLAMLINFVFSTPNVALEKLPSNLISIESAEGKQLLTESNFRDDYPILKQNFVSQSRRAFCGVASSVIIFNSLQNSQPSVNQSSIFNEETRKIIHPLRVTFGGMTLAQLNKIFQANQLDAEAIYASKINAEEFRFLVRKNLSNPDDLILINYRRDALKQSGGGHISPIAAYHEPSDRFLILDVAAYRYPPVLVKAEQLWQGINSIDKVSNLSRGFVLIQK